MTFDQWWTEEVGHPPADERERFAFEMARKAWKHNADNTLLDVASAASHIEVAMELGEELSDGALKGLSLALNDLARVRNSLSPRKSIS